MPQATPATPMAAGTTITETVLDAVRGNAARRAGAALIDPARELGYAAFAEEVAAAADGLRRHGARPGDVGAVHVSGVCDLAVAVHAVSASGAVPALLPPDAAPAEAAALLTESGARFLLAGADTAARTLAAAERSYVRQVFAFGDVPGTTPFARLLEPGPGTGDPPAPDPLRDPALRLCAPPEEITHADRLADLYRLGGALGLGRGDVLVLSGRDVTAPTWIGLTDLCLTQGVTAVGVPGAGTRALLDAILDHGATAAVVTPAKLRAIAFDHGRIPVTGVRLLVTGTPPAEAARACRDRYAWTVSPLC
ncbi:long-chain fatty acid--CoA ligase [Actinomadura sp. KC216]|uniref:AMP-binding protein n=1 Tax=Actinomadura sp. KC216 TaxID=2530370 RepID=UPI00104B3C86|nr:AMP-binding protein [Actinomadura sp. KC216]TDB80544.1 long-chain fatty acid--CoA ligase [Actinomadura sp. KC216]